MASARKSLTKLNSNKIDLLRKEIYQFNIITLTDPNDNEENQI